MRDRIAHPDGHVHPAGFNGLHDANVPIRQEGEFDFGIELAIAAEDLGQAVVEDRLRSAHAEATARSGVLRDCGLRGGDRGENFFCVRKKPAASFGENDAFGEAVEEASTELFFERANLRGHVGLNAMDALCGAGEMELFGQGTEDFKLAHFHGHSNLSGQSLLSIIVIITIY